MGSLKAITVLLLSACVASVSLEAQTKEPKSPTVKNLIILLGDGMGVQHLSLGELFLQHSRKPPGRKRTLAMTEMMAQGETGLVSTSPHGGLAVDSASSMTQFAGGVPAIPEVIGVDRHGESIVSVLEFAKELGKLVGVVSDTRATHATPAAFYAHQRHRSLENEIAVDLIESELDLALGGGLRHFVPKCAEGSKRKDDRDLITEAKAKGFEVVQTLKELKSVHSGRVLGLFAGSHLPDGITHSRTAHDRRREIPTLAEMTQHALRLFDSHPEGFVLLVEGGQIDHAAHEHDTGRLLHEILKFDEAVSVAKAWSKGRQDSLVTVVADHETAGFGISYSSADIPTPRPFRGPHFSKDKFAPRFNFIPPKVLDRIYKQEKSLTSIVKEFEALPEPEQSPEALSSLVEHYLDFSFSSKDAVRVLRRISNPYYVEGHKYLGERFVADLGLRQAFYPYSDNNQQALIGLCLASQQGVVWSTGTHTAQPVPIIAVGPEEVIDQFDGFHTSVQVGAFWKRVLAN